MSHRFASVIVAALVVLGATPAQADNTDKGQSLASWTLVDQYEDTMMFFDPVLKKEVTVEGTTYILVPPGSESSVLNGVLARCSSSSFLGTPYLVADYYNYYTHAASRVTLGSGCVGTVYWYHNLQAHNVFGAWYTYDDDYGTVTPGHTDYTFTSEQCSSTGSEHWRSTWTLNSSTSPTSYHACEP